MNTVITLDNLHKKFPDKFNEQDLNLMCLKNYAFQYKSPLLNRLPMTETGMYLLVGGKLLGKTTLLKQWIAKLLETGISPDVITFFPGKVIKTSGEMIQLFKAQFSKRSITKEYIVIDDINYINDWNKVLTWMISNHLIHQSIIILASGNINIYKQIKKSCTDIKDKNCFHLYPLSFRETVILKHPSQPVKSINLLNEFNSYLLHGGYLPAIHDVTTTGKISDKTSTLYVNGVINELLLLGKHKNYIHEILIYIIHHYLTLVSLNGLVKELSIEHPKTIGNYLDVLAAIDVLFVQSALIEDKLTPAPKKARKLIFSDPFILHAMRAFISSKEYPEMELYKMLDYPDLCTSLVKTCVISHFQQHYPTYYIKDEGEVDLAYITNQRFWPIIISWANQLRSKDIKQIVKYANGKILTKSEQGSSIENIKTESLLQVLWNLG